MEDSLLATVISEAFEGKRDFNQKEVKVAVNEVIEGLDKGRLRVANKIGNEWKTNIFVKQAVLLFFRTQQLTLMSAGDLTFFDKIPLKKWTGAEQVRVVPHAVVRYGSYISPGAVLMPSYVNIGSYVGAGTMVDTWATVGSCAQIGAGVHLSGGVGIGGVLEPVQASPVIIEDHVFIGSRCVVVEGAIVKEGAVLGAGVTITASTKIIDVSEKKEKIFTGLIPEYSVVIPGSRPKKFPAGEYNVPCALIIGKRSSKTDQKTSLNQALRDFDVSV